MPAVARSLPPPLREGDRLDGEEFLRRWQAMPGLKRAELIGGTVFFIPSPVSAPHSDAHTEMIDWLLTYKSQTPGCHVGIDCTWRMGPSDIPQPDLFMRILNSGQSRIEGTYATGAPELIVEVSGSSLSRDLGIKLDLYRQTGVREYITVLLYEPRKIIWRQLVRGRYREIKPSGEDGLLRSHVFPGLWLDPEAVWDAQVSIRGAVEQGVRSPEHAAFVRRLAAEPNPQ